MVSYVYFFLFLVIICSSSHLRSAPREGCASWLCHFPGIFTAWYNRNIVNRHRQTYKWQAELSHPLLKVSFECNLGQEINWLLVGTGEFDLINKVSIYLFIYLFILQLYPEFYVLIINQRVLMIDSNTLADGGLSEYPQTWTTCKHLKC